MAFGAFMASLDGSIVNVSLPTIARVFRLDSGAAAWVILAYLLPLSGCLLAFGRLGDAVGKRRIFLWGQGVFLLGSLGCGLAPGPEALNAARALQGVGGAMLTVSSYALIPQVAPPALLGWGIGILTTAVGLGAALGAPLGGLLTDWLSWRWVFYINLPVGLVSLGATLRYLPLEGADRNPLSFRGFLGRFHLVGAVLSFLGILLLVFGLNQGRELGWSSPIILGSLLGAGAALALFALAERRHPEPLVDRDLMRQRSFRVPLTGSLGGYLFLGGNTLLLPFFLQGAKGLSAQQCGFALLLYSLAYMLFSGLGGRASDRVPPRILCALSQGVSAGLCVFFALTTGSPGLWPSLVFLGGMGMACGFFFPPMGHLVLGGVPPTLRGAASGIFSVANRVCLTLGVCFYETLFSHWAPGGVAEASSPVALGAFRGSYLTAAAVFLAGALWILLVPSEESPSA